MKLSLGQVLPAIVALLLAAILVFNAPFVSTAAIAASSSQVVYAPIFNPPLISDVAGRIDFPLLLLELGFVAFVGGAIFFAASQKKRKVTGKD